MTQQMKKDFHWMLNNTKKLIIDAILPEVLFDGWSQKSLDAAIKKSGVQHGNATLAFPRGLIDVVADFHRDADREMLGLLPDRIAMMISIGQKIKTAVMLRFELASRHKDAVRSATSYFVLPHHAVLGTQLLWGTVDAIWQAVGVEDKGLSHYTRRASLGAIYTSTLMFWLSVDDADLALTEEFLDRRLHDQMRFGKFTSALKSPFKSKANEIND